MLATEATVRPRADTHEVRALRPAAEVEELACSLFVALAEEGWTDGDVAAAEQSGARQKPSPEDYIESQQLVARYGARPGHLFQQRRRLC